MYGAWALWYVTVAVRAGMVELVDAPDSKSGGLRPLGVRVPLPALGIAPEGHIRAWETFSPPRRLEEKKEYFFEAYVRDVRRMPADTKPSATCRPRFGGEDEYTTVQSLGDRTGRTFSTFPCGASHLLCSPFIADSFTGRIDQYPRPRRRLVPGLSVSSTVRQQFSTGMVTARTFWPRASSSPARFS